MLNYIFSEICTLFLNNCKLITIIYFKSNSDQYINRVMQFALGFTLKEVKGIKYNVEVFYWTLVCQQYLTASLLVFNK